MLAGQILGLSLAVSILRAPQGGTHGLKVGLAGAQRLLAADACLEGCGPFRLGTRQGLSEKPKRFSALQNPGHTLRISNPEDATELTNPPPRRDPGAPGERVGSL